MISGLSDRLKAQRITQGLTQHAVAARLGVSPSIISGYETGERSPSLENLLALSYLYHCSTDYLLGKDTKQPSAVNTDGLSIHQLQALNAFLSSLRTQS